MSIDKQKPVKVRSQSFRSLKDKNESRSKTNLQIPLVFSFENDIQDKDKKRSSSSGGIIKPDSSRHRVDNSKNVSGNPKQVTIQITKKSDLNTHSNS